LTIINRFAGGNNGGSLHVRLAGCWITIYSRTLLLLLIDCHLSLFKS
jgi:hypothetical protein